MADRTSGRFALADVAALVGEPTRAAMLLALLDGRALPAGELAREAGLSAAATSLHLTKLTQGGLLVGTREGRHHYFRLAGREVAHALEALGVLGTSAPKTRAARDISPERAALRRARSCYDHLAGEIAVALFEKMRRERLLRTPDGRAIAITARGVDWLAATLHVDAASLGGGRRPLARGCLDWTERRPHVAGAVGAAILEAMIARRWLARAAASRALRVTTAGREAFARIGLGEGIA